MPKFYGYNKCSTCRNAKKWLEQHDISVDDIDITENPPSANELKQVLQRGDYKVTDLLNRSGVLYREMNMKDRVKDMSEAELIKLLAGHGKLIKRPIVLDSKRATVGFKDYVFADVWG